MKYVIFAYEGIYGGCNGVYDFTIIDSDNEKDITDIAHDMSYQVFEDYVLSDGTAHPDDFEARYEYYKFKDEYQNRSAEELCDIFAFDFDSDIDEYVDAYCER